MKQSKKVISLLMAGAMAANLFAVAPITASAAETKTVGLNLNAHYRYISDTDEYFAEGFNCNGFTVTPSDDKMQISVWDKSWTVNKEQWITVTAPEGEFITRMDVYSGSITNNAFYVVLADGEKELKSTAGYSGDPTFENIKATSIVIKTNGDCRNIRSLSLTYADEVDENTCTISVSGHGDWIDRYQNFLAVPFTTQGFSIQPSELIWIVPGRMWWIDRRSEMVDTVTVTAPEGKIITSLGCKGSDLQNLAAVVKDENGERQIGLTSVNGVPTFRDINATSVVIMNKSNNHAYLSDFVISFTDDPDYEEPKVEEPTVEATEPTIEAEEPTALSPAKPHHYYDLILP